MTYKPEMYGLTTFNMLHHTKEGMELEKYNGWNFTNTYIWDSLTPDSYWMNPNTTLLL